MEESSPLRKTQSRVAVMLGTLAAAGALAQTIGRTSPESAALLDQVWELVSKHFVDPDFNGVDWGSARERYRALDSEAQTRAEKREVINRMLSELGASHTRLYTPDEPEYYQVLSIYRRERREEALTKLFPNGEIAYGASVSSPRPSTGSASSRRSSMARRLRAPS